MKKLVWLLVLVMLLVACGASSGAREATDTTAESAPMEEPAMEVEGAAADEAGDFDAGSEVPQAQAVERQIIYTANLRLRVDDPRVVAQELDALVRQFGGYVSNANIFETRDEVYQASVQLRVEADQFDAALAALRGLATEIISEQRDSQDVTDQYVDLRARIDNLERTEAELQVLLTEARERGGDTEDVLAVYRELTEIRGQIERLQGQLNVLSDQVSLATINVELIPPEMQVEIVDEGWSPMSTVRRSLRALTEGLQGLADLAIFFTLSVLPFLLLLALAGLIFLRVLVWLWRRRPDALRPTPRPPAPPAPPDTQAGD